MIDYEPVGKASELFQSLSLEFLIGDVAYPTISPYFSYHAV